MKKLILIAIALVVVIGSFAQKPLTRDEILNMSVEELADLELEQLMSAMDILGVSSMDELMDLLLNKNVQSASKRSENAFDSPLSSTVLTKDEIVTYGATTIEEALRLVPGVIVREKTNGNFDIHLRGLDNIPSKNMLLYSENTNTLLMIDGRPMFNYAHGAIVWESLPIGFEDIERIEVVRGPASALYGSNAVNGVINIITAKTNSSSPLVSGSLKGGYQKTYTGDLAIRKAWNDKFSTAITANAQQRNRDTDKVYVHGVEGLQFVDNFGGIAPLKEGFYSLSQYDKMLKDGKPLKDPNRKISELFPDAKKSRENVGVNAYVSYAANANARFDLSAGYQSSDVNSSPVGDQPTSLSGRTSSTSYANLHSTIGDLSVQANYMFGTQDFAVGDPGFKVDMGQINAIAEYNIQLKELNLRPGVSYQSVFYNDLPYLEAPGKGYLNGKKEINTISASIRADYLAFEKLRLVAALRAEKYNYPDDIYPSWQFAGTLPVANNQTVRAVYSRANRSSFIVNSQSDYLWDRSSREMFPQHVHFGGKEDYDLMKVDMIELGYRVRPMRNLLIDAELFASESRDYGALTADKSSILFPTDPAVVPYAQQAGMIYAGMLQPLGRLDITYQNMPLNARQIGFTVSSDWIINPKLIARMHGTVQSTKLEDYSEYTRDEIAELQLRDAGAKFEQIVGGILLGAIQPEAIPMVANSATSSISYPELKDGVSHKATPTYWGMVGLVYKPIKQIDFSTYGYYYGKQTLVSQYSDFEIDSKFILNLQATYRPTTGFELFLNARNALFNNSQEFAYMDHIEGIYLLGMRFNF